MWWDVAKDVLPAIDYLGSYDFTLDQAEPTHWMELPWQGATIDDTAGYSDRSGLAGRWVILNDVFCYGPPIRQISFGWCTGTLWGGSGRIDGDWLLEYDGW